MTVTARANDSDATVVIGSESDADPDREGHQVAVPIRETVLTVTVTAADEKTQREYRVVLAPANPPVTVSFGASSYSAVEGGASAAVTVRLSRDPGEAVTVPLTATSAGGAAAGDFEAPSEVTFESGGALTRTDTVTAVDDESAEDGESVVLGFGTLPAGMVADGVTSTSVALLDTAPNSAPTGRPDIVGDALVGKGLFAEVDRIGDANGLVDAVFTLQWLRSYGGSDTEIAGATGPLYIPVDGDVGRGIKVRVTYTDDDGYEESVTSEATAAVARPLTAHVVDVPESHDGKTAFTFGLRFSGKVDVTAEAMQDSVLEVSRGVVRKVVPGVVHDPHSGSNYQGWRITVRPNSQETIEVVLPAGLDCSLAGAVCTTDGKRLHEGVQFRVPGPATVNLPPTGLPVIEGTAEVGETLTASADGIEDADGLTGATFAWQWLSNDGNTDTEIEGATGKTYTLAAADEGKTVKVRVTFTDDVETEETLTSEATAAVLLPLTASFEDVPESHDGSTAFTVELRFSEEVELSYWTLKGTGMEVTGGKVTSASRLEQGSNIGWEIVVKPETQETVAVALPAGRACGTAGAICTDSGTHGKQLSGRVEFRVAGPATVNSAPTGLPAIEGTAQVGETLTASADGIADADGLTGAVFSWQWLAVDASAGDGSSETAIEGATEASYTPKPGDVGKTLKVRVTFTDGLGTEESVTSEATESVAALVPGAPRGLAVASLEDGEFVLALVWTAPESDGGSAVTGYRVQWKSGSEEYDGTESSTRQAVVTDLDNLTYRIAGLTAGVEYTVRVMATNTVGDGAPAEATATMADTLAPTLETAAVNESTLTLTWSEALDGESVPAADAFTVEVEGTARDVDAVSVAESAVTLTLASAVAPGEAVTVGYAVPEDDSAARIQDAAGNDAAGFSEVAATNETEGSVNTAPTGLPVISGTPRVGETLTASAEGIEDADGLSEAEFAWQWLSDDGSAEDGTSETEIEGATEASYTLTATEAGKTVRVRVTFTVEGETEETLTSEATAAVNTPATGMPVVDGTVEVGETLTASKEGIADADGLEGVEFAWQWLSDDGSAEDGSSETEIEGATEASYTLTAAEVGRTVRVRVTFTDEAGGEETILSEARAAVPADTRPIAATLSEGDAAPDPERFQVRVSFADAVSGLAVDELSATRVGGDAAAVSGLAEAEAGRAWTAAVATDGAGRYVVWVDAEAAEAGARRSTAAVLAVDVDAEGNAVAVSGPVVTEVTLAAESDGSWTDGDAVRVTLAFTEPVTVEKASGTPTIGLGLGGNARQASYVEGSETASLVFAYSATSDDGTVSAVSVTADSLALNGGTIRDAAGRDADLKHPGIGNAAEPPETVAPAEPLTGFTLVDASSGSEVGALADGGEVTLDNPANGSFGVLVATAADAVVSSVRLELAGAKTASRTLNAAPWSLYGDENGAVLGGGLPAGAYTLTATAYGEADAGGDALQTLSVSFTVVAAETPPVEADALTALFQDVPAEHGGPDSGTFTFRVFFNKEPAVSYMVLRDESFAVTGGTVRKAKRVDGRNDLREIHVAPAGWDDVAVTLAGGRACGTAGAICTAGGEVLSNTLSATIKGPVALEVADARVREAADAVLEFEVSLSRTAGGPVGVDYATADGTAKAGEDFTAASGTLTFAAGETTKTVSVAVLDDAHDEGEETMKLLLSNATGGARIRDGEATGTIENSDPIPKAWLARFGRTVADQVLEAVQGRMAAPRVPGFQGQLAGHSLGGGGPRGDVLPGSEGEHVPEELAEWIRGAADEDGSGALSFGGATRGDEFPGVQWQVPGVESRNVTERDLLAGTAFSLTGGSEDGGFGGLWGRGAISYFDGRDGDLSVDGEVLSAMFGADWTRGRGTAGLVLSHSRGNGGYSSPGGSGDIESALTGLYPWGRFALSRSVEVWGVVGYGSGDLTVTPEGKRGIDTDIDLSMAAAGARGTVVDGGDDGLTLAVTIDGMVVRTTSASVESAAGNLAGSEAKVTRLRLGLEGSRPVALKGGGALVPSFEIGLRQDGGDAETGMGAEFGAGLAWSDPERGISADLRGRGLLTHEDGGFREHGFAGSLAWDPRPDTALGPSLTLSQTVGASASGGMQALLGRESMA